MSADWYYSQNNQRHGPVSLEDLKRLHGGGELRSTDLVWNSSMTDWTAVSKSREFDSPSSAPAAAAGTRGTPAAVPAEAADTSSASASSVSLPAPGVLNYSMRQIETLAFTPRAMDMLRQTKPWVRLIAILMFIGAGFMLIGALVLVFAGAIMSGRGGPPAALALIYVPMALLYIAPAVYLNRYASRINELIQLNRADVLEATLEAQKSFWKFVGIMAAIVISLYLVIFLVGMIGLGFHLL